MKKCNQASINSIESCSMIDGPSIRFVIFFNECPLRCKYCHNPETWILKDNNFNLDEIYKKILRAKPYFSREGGVTFSGGEPMCHSDFIITLSKKLKEDNINIAMDTSLAISGNFIDMFKSLDLILLDIKHTDGKLYKELTGCDISVFESNIDDLNESGTDIWIRQVIVPGIHNNKDYLNSLVRYLKKFENIKKIDFLPYHSLAKDKYDKLGLRYRLDVPDMDVNECSSLYEEFLMLYKKEN